MLPETLPNKSLIKAKFSFTENLLWHHYIPLVPGNLLFPFTFPLLLLIPLHSSLSLFLLWEIISFWRPIWTTTQYVDQIHPDYVILLPQHLHCWDDRHHKPAITTNLNLLPQCPHCWDDRAPQACNHHELITQWIPRLKILRKSRSRFVYHDIIWKIPFRVLLTATGLFL